MANLEQQNPHRPPGSQNQGPRGEQMPSTELPEPAFVFHHRAPERERPLAELPSDKVEKERLRIVQLEHKLEERLEEDLEELETELAEAVVREVIVNQIEQTQAGGNATNGRRRKKRLSAKKKKAVKKSKPVTAKKKSRKPRNSTKKARR